MVLGGPEAYEWLVPKLRLGNPFQAKLLLCERIIYSYCPCAPSRSLGEIDVPKRELGNEAKSCLADASLSPQLHLTRGAARHASIKAVAQAVLTHP
jgi:hypothetical protein